MKFNGGYDYSLCGGEWDTWKCPKRTTCIRYGLHRRSLKDPELATGFHRLTYIQALKDCKHYWEDN